MANGVWTESGEFLPDRNERTIEPKLGVDRDRAADTAAVQGDFQEDLASAIRQYQDMPSGDPSGLDKFLSGTSQVLQGIGSVTPALLGDVAPMRQFLEERNERRKEIFTQVTGAYTLVGDKIMEAQSLPKPLRDDAYVAAIRTVYERYGDGGVDTAINMMKNPEIVEAFAERGHNLATEIKRRPDSPLAIGIREALRSDEDYALEEFLDSKQGLEALRETAWENHGSEWRSKAQAQKKIFDQMVKDGVPEAVQMKESGGSLSIDEFSDLQDMLNPANGERYIPEGMRLTPGAISGLAKKEVFTHDIGIESKGFAEKRLADERELRKKAGASVLEIDKAIAIAEGKAAITGSAEWERIEQAKPGSIAAQLAKAVEGIKNPVEAAAVLDSLSEEARKSFPDTVKALEDIRDSAIIKGTAEWKAIQEAEIEVVDAGTGAYVGTGPRSQFEDGLRNGTLREAAPRSVVASKTADAVPTGMGGIIGKKSASKAAESAGRASTRLAQGMQAMKRLQEVGSGAIGPQAWLAETGTKALSAMSLFSENEWGDDWSQLITATERNPDGLKARELSFIRTQLRAFIARSVPEIAGEQSGRITKEELKITERALKVLSPFATLGQVQGAIVASYQMALVNQDMDRMIAGIPESYNLETLEGTNQLAKDLYQAGMRSMEIAETIRVMQHHRRMVVEMGGGQGGASAQRAAIQARAAAANAAREQQGAR
jgi:hypothetical protein